MNTVLTKTRALRIFAISAQSSSRTSRPSHQLALSLLGLLSLMILAGGLQSLLASPDIDQEGIRATLVALVVYLPPFVFGYQVAAKLWLMAKRRMSGKPTDFTAIRLAVTFLAWLVAMNVLYAFIPQLSGAIGYQVHRPGLDEAVFSFACGLEVGLICLLILICASEIGHEIRVFRAKRSLT